MNLHIFKSRKCNRILVLDEKKYYNWIIKDDNNRIKEKYIRKIYENTRGIDYIIEYRYCDNLSMEKYAELKLMNGVSYMEEVTDFLSMLSMEINVNILSRDNYGRDYEPDRLHKVNISLDEALSIVGELDHSSDRCYYIVPTDYELYMDGIYGINGDIPPLNKRYNIESMKL